MDYAVTSMLTLFGEKVFMELRLNELVKVALICWD